MENNLVFGEKIDGLDYEIREGVYAVIFNSAKDKIAAVRTTRGHYFLPGGGIENSETFEECLSREVLEETGYEVLIGRYIGKVMRYFLSTKREPILSDGYFYLAQFLNNVQEPIDDDHYLEWVDVERIEELFFHDHQILAVKEGLKI
ncbi:NUDIX domain-containing protein [Bacillus sp. FJAT-49705]|uniref:NUDIX domain-containing protein n=1 Tax=Cytobacillus citreus TaxID=2833586 RepID=A0ABS5NXB8_9BACI|nr:NUDIX domain-containing protein [Cytobacillus citreus]MBS4192442.1 NUDIX domain-containing protein [Cytobacillus citreus]